MPWTKSGRTVKCYRSRSKIMKWFNSFGNDTEVFISNSFKSNQASQILETLYIVEVFLYGSLYDQFKLLFLFVFSWTGNYLKCVLSIIYIYSYPRWYRVISYYGIMGPVKIQITCVIFYQFQNESGKKTREMWNYIDSKVFLIPSK